MAKYMVNRSSSKADVSQLKQTRVSSRLLFIWVIFTGRLGA